MPASYALFRRNASPFDQHWNGKEWEDYDGEGPLTLVANPDEILKPIDPDYGYNKKSPDGWRYWIIDVYEGPPVPSWKVN